MKILSIAALVIALAAAPAIAQHAGHVMAPAASGEASKAYAAANMKMHKDMDVKFTGDADADFMRAMIPHHQGAVDMARIALMHGKDPAVRKLAEEVVRSQESEIAQMRDWLARNPK